MDTHFRTRASAIIDQLRARNVINEQNAGYADALEAAGIALDLATEAGVSGQVEYARRGWSAALGALIPPPLAMGPDVSGASDESEFDRIARQLTVSGDDDAAR